MSHNRLENAGYTKGFDHKMARVLLLCLAYLCMLLATSANAATSSGIKTEANPIRVLKSTLSDLADRNQAVLDWQTQEFELIFDLPSDGWYESLDLFLTAIPEGNVGTTTPITVSYNGEKPVSLYGQASRFDAHIRLDPGRIRANRNSLKIRYKTPHKTACLTPADGKWILDLSRSKLATKTRSKPRDLHIIEIDQKLKHPMTSPKRIAIRAVGDNKYGLEALVAQGIASRMNKLPAFQFTTSNADFEVVIGVQDDIRSLVNDKKALDEPTTKAFVDSGSRPKLVLTGNTDADVLALARGFATHQFPSARRKSVTLTEFYSSPRFNPKPIISAGKYRLSEIGDTTIEPSWRPTAAELEFNVVNPDTSQGKLTLNIVKSPTITAASRLKVRLNNQSIGYTKLDKGQKYVSFDIKPGMFRSAGNKIIIEPDLAASAENFTCDTAQDIPSLMVSHRSKLDIRTTAAPAFADLNRFAASGAPLFNSNMPTALVLTARKTSDRAASLKFMGYAAQQFGPRLAQAEYMRALPDINNRAKNILIIGPNAIVDPALIAAAPSALRLALRGKPTTGPNTLTVASLDRYASSNDREIVKTLAQRMAKDARIQTGGIASVFQSPYSDKHVIGVITSDRPSQFTKAMASITKPGYWNGLQGSVSRWNGNTIMMAQMATPLPAGFLPKAPKGAIKDWVSSKWDNTVAWAKSLTNRPVKIKKPKAEKTGSAPVVKTAAVQKPSTITLRGSVSNENLTPRRTPVANTPMILRIKAAAQTGFVSMTERVETIQANGLEMGKVRLWLKDQSQNRTTLIALIIMSLILLIGMATPKFDR